MKSMTGFGRAKLEVNDRIYTIEIKSVNHKYNDISVKLPRNLSYLEDKIKKKVNNNRSRGKIDILVTFENYSERGKNIIINHELAQKYIEELKKVAKENDIKDEISVTEIAKMPDVLTLKNDEDEESTIEAEVLQCLKEAISNFVQMRQAEGNRIKEDLERRIQDVESNIEKISEHSTGLIEEYIVKLEERIKEILKVDVVDQARLATEVVIYADKCSIEEELTRLKSHVTGFKSLLKEENPVGKKIDFLLQEMNREINTTGSKSGCIEITNLVIQVKTQLEDIREQIQNIE